MEREKRKIRLQQFKKGEKGLKKGSVRINSGSQELSAYVMVKRSVEILPKRGNLEIGNACYLSHACN